MQLCAESPSRLSHRRRAHAPRHRRRTDLGTGPLADRRIGFAATTTASGQPSSTSRAAQMSSSARFSASPSTSLHRGRHLLQQCRIPRDVRPRHYRVDRLARYSAESPRSPSHRDPGWRCHRNPPPIREGHCRRRPQFSLRPLPVPGRPFPGHGTDITETSLGRRLVLLVEEHGKRLSTRKRRRVDRVTWAIRQALAEQTSPA